MIQKLIRLSLTPLALALLVFGLITAPVGAHQSEVSQGNDFAITATDHMSGSVCDMERDGFAVTAEWSAADGIAVALETDGGDARCDEVQFRGRAESVVMCEENLQNPDPCTYSDKI